jgi:hypothetical protein
MFRMRLSRKDPFRLEVSKVLLQPSLLKLGRKHSARHDRKHKCRFVECVQHKKGFPTENDLDRHLLSVHNVNKRGTKVYRCFGKGCTKPDKNWPRLDNFKQHLNKMHGEDMIVQLLRMSNEWFDQQESTSMYPSDKVFGEFNLQHEDVQMSHFEPIAMFSPWIDLDQKNTITALKLPPLPGPSSSSRSATTHSGSYAPFALTHAAPSTTTMETGNTSVDSVQWTGVEFQGKTNVSSQRCAPDSGGDY